MGGLGVGAELRRLGVNGGSAAVTGPFESGSMSFSVRNMKKNTTQPIAEMKIQLTSR